jgi:hypothetical protein
LHEHRQRMRLDRIVAFFHEVGGCGLVHCLVLGFLVVTSCSAVIAGLDPAIHRLRKMRFVKHDGCADQVRA